MSSKLDQIEAILNRLWGHMARIRAVEAQVRAEGYTEGRNEGYRAGYTAGFDAGFSEGKLFLSHQKEDPLDRSR